MVYLLLIVGLILLVAGGEGFVRGSVAIAEKLGMSSLLIGLTLVGFGTSLPELVTSVQAALDGAPGIAVGNVVGSNIANILLILGITALIYPIAVDKAVLRRDGAVLVIASLAALAIVLIGALGRIAGLVLVALLIAYVIYSYFADRKSQASAGLAAEIEATGGKQPVPVSILFVIGGLALTVLGARLLVSSAVEIATALGVSETIIGLTVVAVGTSLPELVTSVIAAIRRHTDLALGNIIGSHNFNIFSILGITALIQPIPVPGEIIQLDIWVMLGATALLLGFSYTQREIVRWEGGVLLALYAGYIGWLALGAIG
ncbi:inner membrane protein YrbG, predicted calcium/sodium:proton antiporter [Pelagibacterium halotolerans B2]|uniref:Inner membrane protein YrbG, predicted calcium/sodium:proton antiporter n=1 Tax=Pelagibacterium halotolerans (strain DSM 22347 / JCM 15775 / CGMCC 1.7692 / B2) TaxID=1082931 RepID=G4RFB6_PELHB|nr:calcium/sodium antiporter [Pelagibacterium halotolerans]AEQ51954.1 inner membrane protein YrbG, predicted calcium/sodium:proton antiporter [Pelagibacterium halotolerans B2]